MSLGIETNCFLANIDLFKCLRTGGSNAEAWLKATLLIELKAQIL